MTIHYRTTCPDCGDELDRDKAGFNDGIASGTISDVKKILVGHATHLFAGLELCEDVDRCEQRKN